MSSVHSEQSSNREKLIEHLFAGEVLRHPWCQGITTAEFLRLEVDNAGYDLVIECRGIVRYIQLKSSYNGAKTDEQKINIRLAEKRSGCVVWAKFDAATLDLGPFLWFGGAPGKPLPNIDLLPVAKHSKPNAEGEKTDRPNIRVLKRRAFKQVDSIPEVIECLFGNLAPS